VKIQVLGPGCAKCEELAKRTETVARNLGLDDEIEKVTEIAKIMEFGVMITPALVIDGEVKVSGRVPSPDEIEKMLRP
jgi:small redox-active disulfide protein 2